MSTVADATIRCPRCGTVQPRTLDFCDGDLEGARCGQYLGWSRLPEPPAAQAPPSEAPPAAPSVQMSVELPGFDPQPDGTLVASVHPGETVSVEATLRNVGTIVDQFNVAVQGLPPAWVEPAVASAHLVPIGHEGHSERLVAIALKPPRDYTATAGAYAITISVSSQTRRRVLASVMATLMVRPFFAVTATARPLIAKGRTKARFLVDVRNAGNTPISPSIVPTADDKLDFGTPSGLTAIPPGQVATLPLTVRAPRILIGLPADHQIQIAVDVTGLDATPPPPLSVIFRQKPLVPWWVPVALALLAALALALYAVWPHKVTMPSVVGDSTVFVAERNLAHAGFKGKPQVFTRVLSTVKEGTVIDQSPSPFARVSPSTPVTLRVAVPATYTIIPDLTGMTVGEAEDDLNRRYLKLGKVEPSGAPASRTIASQVPLPGRARSRNTTSVDVVLAPPGQVKVPTIVCLTLSQADKLLTKQGLKLATPSSPATSTEVATGQVPAAGQMRPLGTNVTPLNLQQSPASCDKKSSKSGTAPSSATGSTTTTTPAAGASGSVAAAPAEPVAFDDGSSVRLPSSADVLAPGRQPAWSPDGTLLAVRAPSAVRISAPSDPGRDPTMIRVQRATVAAPAFAPAGSGAPLLAYLATPARGSSRLCLVRVAGSAPDPSCVTLPRLRGRAIAWSPGGHAMLVVGSRPGRSDRPGVMRLRLVGDDPASADAWTVNRLLWRLRLGDRMAAVYDVAYDPRAARLAVVTDGPGRRPRVALLALADWPSLRDARWLAGAACQVAWSPAGERIAVIETDGTGPRACDAAGRLVTVAVDAKTSARTLAVGARNPAWRP